MGYPGRLGFCLSRGNVADGRRNLSISRRHHHPRGANNRVGFRSFGSARTCASPDHVLTSGVSDVHELEAQVLDGFGEIPPALKAFVTVIATGNGRLCPVADFDPRDRRFPERLLRFETIEPAPDKLDIFSGHDRTVSSGTDRLRASHGWTATASASRERSSLALHGWPGTLSFGHESGEIE